MKIKLETELVWALYNGEVEDDCYKLIRTEYWGTWRWGVNYRMIIQDLTTGKYFAAICQEQIGDHYYNSFDPDYAYSPIEFTEVVPFPLDKVGYKEVTE